jgi:hypothetical protein
MMAKKVETLTEPAAPAHDEVSRLRNMRDELKQRIEQLQARAGDTSGNVDGMLSAQRELAMAQVTLSQIERSIAQAEIAELEAKWQEHEKASQAHAKHATNLQSLYADDRELVVHYIGETRITGDMSNEEIAALTKSFERYARTARDLAIEHEAMMMHVTMGSVVREEIRLRQRRG